MGAKAFITTCWNDDLTTDFTSSSLNSPETLTQLGAWCKPCVAWCTFRSFNQDLTFRTSTWRLRGHGIKQLPRTLMKPHKNYPPLFLAAGSETFASVMLFGNQFVPGHPPHFLMCFFFFHELSTFTSQSCLFQAAQKGPS